MILSAVHSILQVAEYLYEEYYLTNKRLIIKKGIFSDNITDIPIEKLEGINLVQGFLGSLFNYGTICLLGLGGSRPCLIAVERPQMLRRKIDLVMEKNRTITIIQGNFPKPVEKAPKPAKPQMPEIFSYGTIVRQYGPRKKD
jgi:uncharacterized membrane protein YdbT with pleckstrin-like domain